METSDLQWGEAGKLHAVMEALQLADIIVNLQSTVSTSYCVYVKVIYYMHSFRRVPVWDCSSLV